jgi:hypothetical protein
MSMWALLSRRLRRWVLLAFALPLLARVLDRVADQVESRSGPTPVAKGLRGAARLLPGGPPR